MSAAAVSRVLGRAEAIDVKRPRAETGVTPEPPPQASVLAGIRYADPAAWVTVNAIAAAVEPARSTVLAAHDRVGVVVTSAEGPVEAMAAMCEASRGGSSSPIRFPASNAGSLAGLGSIAFGFRGPTLVLTLPADRGVPVALLLAEAWLGRGVVDFVVVAATFRRDGAPVSRCVLLGHERAAGNATGATDVAPHLAWLSEGR